MWIWYKNQENQDADFILLRNANSSSLIKSLIIFPNKKAIFFRLTYFFSEQTISEFQNLFFFPYPYDARNKGLLWLPFPLSGYTFLLLQQFFNHINDRELDLLTRLFSIKKTDDIELYFPKVFYSTKTLAIKNSPLLDLIAKMQLKDTLMPSDENLLMSYLEDNVDLNNNSAVLPLFVALGKDPQTLTPTKFFIIQRLLAYGANACLTTCIEDSFFETACKYKHFELIDMIMISKNKLPRVLTVNHSNITTGQNRVITSIQFAANRLIQFEICETRFLNPDDLKEIFSFYSEIFTPSKVMRQHADGNHLEHFFYHEFEGLHFLQESKYRLIEIAREKTNNQNKLIGINLYELFLVNGLLVLHISGIFFKKQARGCGLTDPLVFSLPHELQLLFAEIPVVCVYQSISYGSAKLVNDIAFFPKRATPALKKLAGDILPHIQRHPISDNEAPQFYSGPAKFYSEIEVEVVAKELKKSSPASPQEMLFEYMRNKEMHHGALIMFLVGSQSWNSYKEKTKIMKIDAETFTTAKAKKMALIIPDLKPNFKKNKFCFYNSDDFFKSQGIKIQPYQSEFSLNPIKSTSNF